MARGPPVEKHSWPTNSQELRAWTRRSEAAQALALGGRIFLLCDGGLTNTGAARRLGAVIRKAGRWRRRFIEESNTAPKPFKWAASADQVPGKTGAFCKGFHWHHTRSGREFRRHRISPSRGHETHSKSIRSSLRATYGGGVSCST